MGRRHLIELHEQPWYPACLRSVFQFGLGRTIVGVQGLRGAAVPLARLLQAVRPTQILDLCSGSALPSLDVVEQAALLLRCTPPLLVLSDLYPDRKQLAQLEKKYPGRVSYVDRAVDARDAGLDETLPRARMICTALHHFRPEEAIAILAAAVAAGDGIAVFEPQDRTAVSLLSVGVASAMSGAVSSYGIRPWRPWHPVVSVMLPIIPLTTLIDGIVSCLRSYRPDELLVLAHASDPDKRFVWAAGTFPFAHGLAHGVYLTGWRRGVADTTKVGERVNSGR